MLGSLFILREETVAAFKEQFKDLADIPDGIIFWILAAATFIVLAVALAIRAYVGLSAIAEGRGKRRKSAYIVLAIIMILAGIASFIAGFFSASSPEQYGALSRNQSFSALIIEATSMIMMIQMIVSAIKVRTLTRKGRNAKD